ncbi:MAG: hypothetical protein ABSA26_05470 [Thermoguttaceae bacterium]
MEDKWDEEDEEELEPASWFKRPQFSLRTLMIVVTGAAVLCSLVAWLGYAVLFILAAALGIFLGLLICSSIGLGFAFEDLRWDIAKCFIVACATIAPLYLLPYILPSLNMPILSSAIYLFTPVFFYWLGMNTAWNDLELHEIFITAVISFFTWALVSYVTSLVTKLIFGG